MIDKGVHDLMAKNTKKKKDIVPFDIEETYTNYEKSKYHIICAPYAETVSYLKGAEDGPNAILKATHQVELYDAKTKREPYLEGISISEINTSNDITKILEDTEKEVLNCFKSNKFPILLGGEHTISRGAFTACKKFYDDVCIVQIDAHADLRKEYLGDPYSHACAMRGALDNNINLIQVGIRSLCKEEHNTIKQNADKITTFFSDQNGIKTKKVIKSIKNKNVYLTIDLDGFDPSVFPHLGTPEPGGLSWYKGLKIIQSIFENFNVIGADIVELAPSENSIVSDFSAAKLLHKLLCFKK